MSNFHGCGSRCVAWCSSAMIAVAALCALAGPVAPAGAQSCPTDINGDGLVNAIDLGMVLGTWGQCGAVVTGVSPQHGSTLGGTQITITGSALQSTTAVMIGGVACTGLQVLSSTQVRAITPPGAVGDAAITVESPQGPAWAPMAFTYVLQAITAVTPSQGPYLGGMPITITGSYLGGATVVTVGGVPATNVVAVNATTVTAVTPAGSVGDATVTVMTPKGTATANGVFSYNAGPSWGTVLDWSPSPGVVTDVTMYAGILASGLPWRVRDSATQIEMLLVPPGTFTMGCSPSTVDSCHAHENPVHVVTLTSGFYIGRYEVTQAQWAAVMGSNPSFFAGAPDGPSRPAESVSWTGVQSFLAATGMRLPTEAEWEYACRAGTVTAYHSGPGFPNGADGTNIVPLIAWYAGNSFAATHPGGGKAANGLGLFDMAGNVWEFVSDWYGFYPAAAQTDPTGPGEGTMRVKRGGAWTNPGDWTAPIRSSFRGVSLPETSDNASGFRVARNPF